MPHIPQMKWTTPRVVALAGVSLLAGTVLFGVASAQTPTPAPTRQQKAEEHLNRFAQNLGVDAFRVKEAMQQTALQYIDEALAAGRITTEQAQAMRDRVNSGQFGPAFGFGPGKHGGMHRGAEGLKLKGVVGAASEALAQSLGITQEQLRTELNGKSLAEVAAAHGKSADELKQFIAGAAEQRLNEAVAAGRIDQARATQALEMLTSNLDALIDHVHQPHNFQRGGFRGPSGGPGTGGMGGGMVPGGI